MDNEPNNDGRQINFLNTESLDHVKRILLTEHAEMGVEEDGATFVRAEIHATDQGMGAIGYEALHLEYEMQMSGDSDEIYSVTPLKENGDGDTTFRFKIPRHGAPEWTTSSYGETADESVRMEAITRLFAEQDDDDEISDIDHPMTLEEASELELVLSSALIDAGAINPHHDEE